MADIGGFEITCSKCGSVKIKITNIHNDHEAYIKIKCKDCGNKTEL